MALVNGGDGDSSGGVLIVTTRSECGVVTEWQTRSLVNLLLRSNKPFVLSEVRSQMMRDKCANRVGQ